jgi:hypothetical protein
VNIVQRHGEDQSPEEFRDPVQGATTTRFGAPADDMVACVDGLEQRIHVICGPRLHRGCNQHQWHVGIFETTAKSFRQTKIRDGDDSMLDWPSEFGDSLGERGDDSFGLVVRQFGEDHDSDARAGKGIAFEVGREGVVGFLGRGH